MAYKMHYELCNIIIAISRIFSDVRFQSDYEKAVKKDEHGDHIASNRRD